MISRRNPEPGMENVDESNASASRYRLYQVVARLLHAHERRDTLAQESAEAEREMKVVPADLPITLSDAERALVALEAEVLDAVYAVIAADRR